MISTFAICKFDVDRFVSFDIIVLILNIFSVIYMFTVPRNFRRYLLILDSRRLKQNCIDTLIVLVYSFECISDWILYSLSKEENARA